MTSTYNPFISCMGIPQFEAIIVRALTVSPVAVIIRNAMEEHEDAIRKYLPYVSLRTTAQQGGMPITDIHSKGARGCLVSENTNMQLIREGKACWKPGRLNFHKIWENCHRSRSQISKKTCLAVSAGNSRSNNMFIQKQLSAQFMKTEPHGRSGSRVMRGAKKTVMSMYWSIEHLEYYGSWLYMIDEYVLPGGQASVTSASPRVTFRKSSPPTPCMTCFIKSMGN